MQHALANQDSERFQVAKNFLGNLLEPFLWKSAKSLFVLSTGRTATMTFVHLLNLPPEILAFHEPSPLLGEDAKAAYNDWQENTRKYEKLFCEARKLPIAKAWVSGKIYAERTAMISFSHIIARKLAGSKFIHLHRHPADIVRSGMRRNWYRGHPRDNFRLEPLPGDPVYSKWHNDWDAFERICWFWARINDYIFEFSKTISQERFLAVRFENFINPETKTYREIFDFLGVESPRQEKVLKVLSKKLNEQTSGSFPPWEEWPRERKAALNEIAGPVMTKLGYERLAL